MNSSTEITQGWHLTRIETFWNKIAFQKKVFHVYENDDAFIGILAGFVGTAINADECAVVIASNNHLEKLKAKLAYHGLHIPSLIEDQRFVPISAESVMNKFMMNGVPSESLFFDSISDILARPKVKNRQIRAYREMSSLLLQQGNTVGSIQLENLWTKYCSKEDLSLFCAYRVPNTDACKSLRQIGIYNCKIVSSTPSASQILYKDCIES